MHRDMYTFGCSSHIHWFQAHDLDLLHNGEDLASHNFRERRGHPRDEKYKVCVLQWYTSGPQCAEMHRGLLGVPIYKHTADPP